MASSRLRPVPAGHFLLADDDAISRGEFADPFCDRTELFERSRGLKATFRRGRERGTDLSVELPKALKNIDPDVLARFLDAVTSTYAELSRGTLATTNPNERASR